MQLIYYDEIDRSGIYTFLSGLADDAIISEEALCRFFDRHLTTIKRSIDRGELPPSIKMFGQPVWTAGAIRTHLNKRLADAAAERYRVEKELGLGQNVA